MSNTKTLSPSILAMYLGCEVQTTIEDVIFRLEGVRHTEFDEWVVDLVSTNLSPQCRSSNRFIDEIYTPQQFTYLLSKHFDLFNLIPDGLAVDKTTLK